MSGAERSCERCGGPLDGWGNCPICGGEQPLGRLKLKKQAVSRSSDGLTPLSTEPQHPTVLELDGVGVGEPVNSDFADDTDQGLPPDEATRMLGDLPPRPSSPPPQAGDPLTMTTGHGLPPSTQLLGDLPPRPAEGGADTGDLPQRPVGAPIDMAFFDQATPGKGNPQPPVGKRSRSVRFAQAADELPLEADLDEDFNADEELVPSTRVGERLGILPASSSATGVLAEEDIASGAPVAYHPAKLRAGLDPIVSSGVGEQASGEIGTHVLDPEQLHADAEPAEDFDDPPPLTSIGGAIDPSAQASGDIEVMIPQEPVREVGKGKSTKRTVVAGGPSVPLAPTTAREVEGPRTRGTAQLNPGMVQAETLWERFNDLDTSTRWVIIATAAALLILIIVVILILQ